MTPNSKQEAFELLRTLHAPARLQRHAELVLEVAEELLRFLSDIDQQILEDEVRIGAILHDAGKVEYPQELEQPGRLHEAGGKELLLQHGVAVNIAEYCVAHADWKAANRTIEHLLVALADKLWKGKREEELEKKVIEAFATRNERDYWELFMLCDSFFENIAETGLDRLSRSQSNL